VLNDPSIPIDPYENYRYLRLKEVLALVPVSRSSWFSGVAAGRFPRPVSWGPRTKAYDWPSIKRLLENPEHWGPENG
jgi:prophage regulatory protein